MKSKLVILEEILKTFWPLRSYGKFHIGWFKGIKFCHFERFYVSELRYFGNFSICRCKIFLNIEIQTLQNCQNGKFWPLQSTKLISRKIWLVVKSWNFHTVFDYNSDENMAVNFSFFDNVVHSVEITEFYYHVKLTFY